MKRKRPKKRKPLSPRAVWLRSLSISERKSLRNAKKPREVFWNLAVKKGRSRKVRKAFLAIVADIEEEFDRLLRIQA